MKLKKLIIHLRSQAEPDYIDEILNFADEKEIGDNHKIKEIKMNFINQL
jgi:S-DNA-T family DNA segregation ATPase FtsK/SpoIIIE